MEINKSTIEECKTKYRNLQYYDDVYSDIPLIRETYEARLFARNILELPELKNVQNQDYLEIGFGSGLTLEGFWNRGLASATGIEQSEKAIHFLKNRLGPQNGSRSLELIHGNAETASPTLKSHSFDLIVMSNFLEHVRDDVRMLKNIFNLLKFNGILCITYPTPYSDDDPSHYRTYSPESIVRLAHQTLKNFSIVKNQYQSPCLLGWLYAYLPPILFKLISRISHFFQKGPPPANPYDTKYTPFIRKMYYKYIVPLMIKAAPLDDCLGRFFGFGHQGVILVKRLSP